MGTRPLRPDEAALWARVMAGVRPMRAVVSPAAPSAAAPAALASPKTPASAARSAILSAAPVPKPAAQPDLRKAQPVPAAKRAATPSNTLDGTWDRQIARGLVSPDRTIDLHGHTLHSAHDLLDAALDASIRAGDRTILLVTGKPPRPTSERPHARGAIRAATGDWLAGSRHNFAIAAVRPAHPRHGGAGALYIILKRPKISRKS